MTDAERAFDVVEFISRPKSDTGFTPHKGAVEQVTRRLEESKADWARILFQVDEMATAHDAVREGGRFEVDEISVGLAFNAKGRLAFIAEAGVEATVTVVLKRRASM